jgi:hypothetical protein
VGKPHVTKVKKGRQVKSYVKNVIITFFDIKAVVKKNCLNGPNCEFRVFTAKFCGVRVKTSEDLAPKTG